jgi:hypothetical protein
MFFFSDFRLTEFGNSGGHIRLYGLMGLLIVLQILFVSSTSHLLSSGWPDFLNLFFHWSDLFSSKSSCSFEF